MAKQVMDFRCNHGVAWREWHSLNEPFDCPECGKRLYTPASAQQRSHLTAFGVLLLALIVGLVFSFLPFILSQFGGR